MMIVTRNSKCFGYDMIFPREKNNGELRHDIIIKQLINPRLKNLLICVIIRSLNI